MVSDLQTSVVRDVNGQGQDVTTLKDGRILIPNYFQRCRVLKSLKDDISSVSKCCYTICTRC